MEVYWPGQGSVWLLIPDEPDLIYTLNRPPRDGGYDKIVVAEELMVRFRESEWYHNYVFGNYLIATLFIVRSSKIPIDQPPPPGVKILGF